MTRSEVTIERKDNLELDLSEADVVTLFLLPELNVRLIPKLRKMKPGSRVVSHRFDILIRINVTIDRGGKADNRDTP